jgi:hypothetical protein
MADAPECVARRDHPRSANWITDDLPPGIASVTWGIYTLTSTVTAVTAMFRVDERRAGELHQIINQDIQPCCSPPWR